MCLELFRGANSFPQLRGADWGSVGLSLELSSWLAAQCCLLGCVSLEPLKLPTGGVLICLNKSCGQY